MKLNCTRRRAQSFTEPIRKALLQLRSGECDADGEGFPVLLWKDGEHARIDWALNGYLALIRRLRGNLRIKSCLDVSRRLAAGELLTVALIDDAMREVRSHEDAMVKMRVSEIAAASKTEMVNIELESLGLKPRDELEAA